MFRARLRNEKFPEEQLVQPYLAQQSDIGLRHARWLAKRFNIENASY